MPIVLACAIWGPRWQHRHLLSLCDNMSVVHIIWSRTSRDRTIMHLLRTLHFLCATFDICLRTVHIPGTHNTYADAISRNSMQVLLTGLPAVHHQPCPITGALMSLLVYTQPDWLPLSTGFGIVQPQTEVGLAHLRACEGDSDVYRTGCNAFERNHMIV